MTGTGGNTVGGVAGPAGLTNVQCVQFMGGVVGAHFVAAQAAGRLIVKGENSRVEMTVGTVEQAAVGDVNRRQINRIIEPVVRMTGAALLGANLGDILPMAHVARIGEITAAGHVYAVQVGYLGMSIRPSYTMAGNAVLPGGLEIDCNGNFVTDPAGHPVHVTYMNGVHLVIFGRFVAIFTSHGVGCGRVAGNAVG